MKLKKKKIEDRSVSIDDGKYTPDPESMIQVFDLTRVYQMGEVEVRALDGVNMKMKENLYR